ncbi:MAG TPA: hypothetical protein VK947_08120 [Planococcus sp. (in: firmicutes)]|nr:hypothetical protein [Planococcus sp. (in: firmicutes)]
MFILFAVFGTLAPAIQQMQHSIHLKKERAIAYETLHEAAKQVLATSSTEGVRMVDEMGFYWKYSGSLCVRYESYQGIQKNICES